MIRAFSGRTHTVFTGIALIDQSTGRKWVAHASSRVTFHRLSAGEIKNYLTRIHPLDKAGAYAVQDGEGIVKSVKGSFSNVMGLPLELLRRAMARTRPSTR